MPTKRPDQLPSGQNFDFDDILIVEKNPNGSSRQLNKSTIRDFMKSATELDPERVGENPILGLQSSFEWMVQQINSLAQDPISPVTSYESFDSESKNAEQIYVSPTPTPTITVTPTVSTTPFKSPTPTPTLTPTPSKTPYTRRVQITFQGPQPQSVALPISYLPEARGFTNWSIVGGTANEQTSLVNFFGYFPDSFTPSALNEVLIYVNKLSDTHIQISSAIEDSEGDIEYLEGLFENASITFTIDYS